MVRSGLTKWFEQLSNPVRAAIGFVWGGGPAAWFGWLTINALAKGAARSPNGFVTFEASPIAFCLTVLLTATFTMLSLVVLVGAIRFTLRWITLRPMPPGHPLLIAVDGPAASGKGTIAARLADHFDLPYLDTGLLYRAVGLAVLRAGGDLDDADQAAQAARALDLSALDNPDLTSRAAGDAASRVGFHPAVRAALRALQTDFAARPGGAVLDGRDIGTVIAPDADVKLYVTAAAEVRAERRFRQLHARGEDVTYDAILDDIRKRDARDAGRETAPMTAAADAVLLDTSLMDIEAAFDAARRIVEAARAS